MVKCILCGETDPSKFHNKGDRSGKERPSSWCKPCQSIRAGKRAIGNRKDWVEYLGIVFKCERCGYDKYEGAIEFHHTDPSLKTRAISSLMRGFNPYRSSPEKVAAVTKEIKSCSILCANCHREVHSG